MHDIPSSYTWKWKWDEEFYTALVVFETKYTDTIFFTVSKEFDDKWDYSTVDNSAEYINVFTNSVGILPGQIIFTSTEESALVLFATWWPWGDGERISLRIGMFSPEEQVLNRKEIKEQLAEWFALSE
ncbi:MAG TPA: hypothetical protein DDW42_10330 [Desulfobacteraceae bacterium]|nr:hypothetical protein [Desulfobacteraceae bacterium]